MLVVCAVRGRAYDWPCFFFLLCACVGARWCCGWGWAVSCAWIHDPADSEGGWYVWRGSPRVAHNSGRRWESALHRIARIGQHDIIFGGGDRNHIRYPHERMHSAAGHRCGRPNHQLNQTFDDFCAAFNHCSILDQPDFTMVRKDNDHVMCSVLDVMFTNADMLTEPLYFPVSYRVPTPDSESRDHSPVALKWVVASRKKGRTQPRQGGEGQSVRSLPSRRRRDL